MSKQIDRILICLLWLLAATLGTCFWLNTMFGFNIFSAQHWQYLAYLQAAQTPVRPAFYISLTCAIIISLVVLYVLIRPRGMLRRRLGIGRATRNATPTAKTSTTADAHETTQNVPQSETPAPAAMQQNNETTPVMTTRPGAPLARPRHLGVTLRAAPVTTPAPNTTPTPAPAAPPATIDFDVLREIFSDAGYVVKRSPRVANFKPAVFAIGTGETLWLGGVGIDTAKITGAMERLDTIFTDTLDDIKINISGFIIAPTTGEATENLHLFKTTDDLREYITAHKNTPPADADGQENFDAYSEYIDTVINYMDKT